MRNKCSDSSSLEINGSTNRRTWGFKGKLHFPKHSILIQKHSFVIFLCNFWTNSNNNFLFLGWSIWTGGWTTDAACPTWGSAARRRIVRVWVRDQEPCCVCIHTENMSSCSFGGVFPAFFSRHYTGWTIMLGLLTGFLRFDKETVNKRQNQTCYPDYEQVLRYEHGSVTFRPVRKLWQIDQPTDQPTVGHEGS